MIRIINSGNSVNGISTFNETLSKFYTINGYRSYVTNDPTEKARVREDDLVIFSRRECVLPNLFNKKANNIFVVHGLHNKSFLPPDNVEFSEIWTLSKKAKEFCEQHRKEKVSLVPQLIDDKFWKVSKTKDDDRVLIIDPRNWGFYANNFLKVAGEIEDMTVRVVPHFKTKYDLRSEILRAKIVVAYGRSAYESIMMAKPTIIFGHNGGDGHVNCSNFNTFTETNLSGWSTNRLKCNDIDSIRKEFSKANSMGVSEALRLRKTVIPLIGLSSVDVDIFLNGYSQ